MKTPNVVMLVGYVPHLSHYANKPKLLEKYAKARSFYGSSQAHDYVQYVHLGSKEKLDFVDYSGASEKSSGVFNKYGLLNKNQIKELKQNLKDTKSVIWHGVISFEEEFGKKLCDNNEQAYELMKLELPKFLKNTGLDPKNISWFAGLHKNTDNRHIHFSFYEIEPKRIFTKHEQPQFSYGKIKNDAIEKFKLNIELNLTQWSKRIALQRSELTNSTKEYIQNNLYNFRSSLLNDIKKLAVKIPLIGRMSYDSENMKPLKSQIDNIANMIIRNDKELLKKFESFFEAIHEKEEDIKIICVKNNANFSKYSLMNKYTEDIYRRIGNQILYNLKMIKIRQDQIAFETTNRLIKKRIEKSKMKALIKECIYLEKVVKNETMDALDEFLKKLEQANYQRLIEEGIIIL
jgi:hypothetical protein